jgi:hypothetical protein
MDTTLIIRIVSGTLAIVALAVVVYRRKQKAV